VANPNKTKSTQDILLKNKDKLVEFLSKFHTDRTGWCVCVLKRGREGEREGKREIE
jgi:hypothetical protein